MPISIRDRKLLWGRSGNECAFPACAQQLVLESQGTDVIVGEEAHIHARNRGGPRTDEGLSSAQLDEYANLILLCPTHHTVVDAQANVFTASVLREMKATHERTVRERSLFFGGGLSTVLNVHCPGTTTNVWQFGNSAVVACSYGSPPVAASGRWRGSGIQFQQAAAGGYTKLLLDSSEAQADIEYWLEGQELHVVRLTFLYDEHSFTPFIEHIFRVAHVPAQEDLIVLAQGDPQLVDEIPHLVEQLLVDEWSPRTSAALRSLYSAGLVSPEAVLYVAPHLRRSKIFAGAEAAAISDLERELKLIMRARAAL